MNSTHMPSGDKKGIRKGVYHFRSHQEARRHHNECLIATITQIARQKY
jgi:hypothetical protein